MPTVHRLKHSFSAGELSPMMDARVDFTRYNNGCKTLLNAVCTTQGPATRRSGFKFIYDLTTLGLDITDPRVRQIPFIFNELQAYDMIFFMHTDGSPRIVFGDGDGLLAYPDPVSDFCPNEVYETITPFTGAATYDCETDISTAADWEVRHVASGGAETVMVVTTDYTFTVNDPTPHDLIVSNAYTSDGHIEIWKKQDPAILPGDVVSLTLPAAWDIDNFDWAQSADEMFIAQSGFSPYSIKRWGAYCWELVSLGFTDQPADWSADNGWPERITFHQQRLVFAANTLRRQTVWMSKAGNFTDFGVSGSPVDSDAITFTLDSGTQNKIVWMNSAKALNIGTIGSEWTVVGATRTAITPSNVLAQRQTNLGGEPNKPLMVGITTLFVEKYGRAVNEFVYDFNVDSYTTSDMSILSDHITRDYSITDWTYQQTPDSVIWAVRADGTLLGITYQRQHEVIGWHVHTTDGLFKSITSTPGDSREDEVWAIVNRTIDGAEVYYLEKMAEKFKEDDAINAPFLDSSIKYSGSPASVFTGLDHLEGETVDVLADGTAHPSVVVTSGQVTLNADYSDVLVGMGFDSEVWPNLADIPTQLGTVIGKMQRSTYVDIDFYNTLGGYIGRVDSEDGTTHEEEIIYRVPGDLTGTAVPLWTGIKHLSFPEGFDRKVSYYIKQTQPLPMTIRAAVDTVEYFE